jgi:hypothetical protein
MLPKLLPSLGKIDMFIHDSLHSEHNVRFELNRVWGCLGPNGVIVVDDVDANGGLQSFIEEFSIDQAIISDAEPLRPDTRRPHNERPRGCAGSACAPGYAATIALVTWFDNMKPGG